MGDLSPNFSFSKFCYSSLADHWVKSNPLQFWLAKRLAQDILQPGRDRFGRFKEESGIRDPIIWGVLHEKGLKPSKTTDHSYLDPEVNQWGVGALDFIPLDSEPWDVYKWYVQKLKDGVMGIGQIIIYPQKNTPFIHISNPPGLLYSFKLIEKLALWKNQMLVRADGKYIPYDQFT